MPVRFHPWRYAAMLVVGAACGWWLSQSLGSADRARLPDRPHEDVMADRQEWETLSATRSGSDLVRRADWWRHQDPQRRQLLTTIWESAATVVADRAPPIRREVLTLPENGRAMRIYQLLKEHSPRKLATLRSQASALQATTAKR